MDPITRRILLVSCRLFRRLDGPARTWLLARLTADDADLRRDERRARFDEQGLPRGLGAL